MKQELEWLQWRHVQSNYTMFESVTFVATAKMAMPWRMGCQAPMSWAFSGVMRRNWVMNFQASTRISNMLLIRARTGARGKEATKSVTKPNWMTVRETGDTGCGHEPGFHDNKLKQCPKCDLTHLKIFIEQPQFGHGLELVVLLPARSLLLYDFTRAEVGIPVL